MKRSSVSLVFNIFLGIGLLLLIISLVICYRIKKFDAAAVKTSGTVVDMLERSRSSNSSSPTYTPVVTYEDGNGVKHRYIPSYSSNPPGYNIGETVQVYYDPKNPGDAKIAGWLEYLGAFITGGLGLVFGLIGAGYYITGFSIPSFSMTAFRRGAKSSPHLSMALTSGNNVLPASVR